MIFLLLILEVFLGTNSSKNPITFGPITYKVITTYTPLPHCLVTWQLDEFYKQSFLLCLEKLVLKNNNNNILLCNS